MPDDILAKPRVLQNTFPGRPDLAGKRLAIVNAVDDGFGRRSPECRPRAARPIAFGRSCASGPGEGAVGWRSLPEGAASWLTAPGRLCPDRPWRPGSSTDGSWSAAIVCAGSFLRAARC